MSDKVTYADIVDALSRKTGFSKQKCEAFAKALIQEIKTELQENGKASITNFGSFKVKDVAERQGQNPQTGEPLTIPAHKRVTFSPYKALRTKVNAKYEHLESRLIDDESQDEAPIPPVTSEKTYEEAVSEQSNRIYFILAVAVLLIIISLGLLWFANQTGSEQVTEAESTEQTITTESENEPTPDTETGDSTPASQSITSSVDDTDPEEQMANASDAETEGNAAMEEPVSSMPTTAYQVQEDEWYWVISEREYGEAHYWPIIFMENFSVDHHPDSLENNTNLRIPSFDGSPDALTGLDYQRLSEASQLVSDAYANFGRNDKATEYARFAVRWERMAGDQ